MYHRKYRGVSYLQRRLQIPIYIYIYIVGPRKFNNIYVYMGRVLCFVVPLIEAHWSWGSQDRREDRWKVSVGGTTRFKDKFIALNTRNDNMYDIKIIRISLWDERCRKCSRKSIESTTKYSVGSDIKLWILSHVEVTETFYSEWLSVLQSKFNHRCLNNAF